jgi:hypothetical protein
LQSLLPWWRLSFTLIQSPNFLNSKLFVALSNYGIYQSLNNGISWSLSIGIPSISCFANLKEDLFAANVWVVRFNQTRAALVAPTALPVNTPTYWGRLAMPLAQTALGGRSHLPEQLAASHVP